MLVLGRLARYSGLLFIRLGVGFLLSSCLLASSAQAAEAALRVAFVYNFIKFIEWPELGQSSVSLCALGAQGVTRDALGQLEKKARLPRPIQVIYLDTNEALQDSIGRCQMLYQPQGNLVFSLPELIPTGVLLVADEPDQRDARVGIALVRSKDNRIEFSINQKALEQAGVKVSSQLLKLAKKPRKGGK